MPIIFEDVYKDDEQANEHSKRRRHSFSKYKSQRPSFINSWSISPSLGHELCCLGSLGSSGQSGKKVILSIS